MDHSVVLANGPNRTTPETILRFSPIGECLAMLMGAQALFVGTLWLTQWWNPLSWFVASASVWYALRTIGWMRGKTLTVVISATLATGLYFFSFSSALLELPNWLQKGPFSVSALSVALSIICVLDCFEWLWLRGWTPNMIASFLRETALHPKSWGWLLASILFGYMVVVPGIDALLEPFRAPGPTSEALPDMTFSETLRLRTTELFMVCWFFSLGATIGSFLNVIVYRSPRYESLIRKRSACPSCGQRIDGRDNIPVLAWILLNGKCRNCSAPISMRYPVVEAVTGGIFLLLYFVELISGGQNLPSRFPNLHTGVVWTLLYTKWDLVGYYLYHCLLLISLLTWALIRMDGQKVPLRAIATTFLMAGGPLIIRPELLLVSWSPVQPSHWELTASQAILTAIIGASIGALIAILVLKSLLPRTTSNGYEREFVAGAALIGTVMGWQATCSIIALTLLLQLLQHILALSGWGVAQRWPLTGLMLVATTIQLCFWRWIVEHLSACWPTTGFNLLSMIVWAATCIGLIVLNRKFESSKATSAPEMI
ncbi:Leader peptidase PppA [Thalassoglobus neptunius]|uniref:Leader peptidase PppA n=1 Tax=Thalassoglobus neptunius TaxID=1938619 RepID=A0A5C5X481_9PLAN|nr:prepilin peptidase [Thalassoglobus neptunius]TWT57389.1 Leader peptidase PppA [Thalassoglobus neptunius]